MSLEDQIIVSIVDKLLIGVLLLILGFWLNARLEKLKGQIELGKATASFRAAAYGALWEYTEPLSPRGKGDIDAETRKTARENLTKWYYAQGNALYLSLDAADLFLRGLPLLDDESNSKSDVIRSTFSALRTQLKVDIGVYSLKDATVQIPRAS